MDMENLDFDPPLLSVKPTELLIAINAISALIVTNLEEEKEELIVVPMSALDLASFHTMAADSSVPGPVISDSLVPSISPFIIPESFAFSVTKRSRLEHDREAKWEQRRLIIQAKKERKRREKQERREAKKGKGKDAT
ncbi:hypothetical protein NA56DRAFT_652774 [Hyaloscypha hepaticicola]|uniref:Uncharacterized protein n=1 Tax=Hyaloscypha hepaticicola TaxID=2082293 RepID=A0A2J6PDB2_9HELO|nr:hypothetical protein NA56DRAFT_652774 [Hyaloscypha hepaticicola]